MRILSRLWPRLEKVPASLTDPELRHQSLLLARLLLVVLLLGGLSVTIQSALVPGFRQTSQVLALALGLLVLAMVLNQHGWFRTAGLIAVSVMLAGCFGVLIVNPQDALVYAYLVVPLFLARLFLPGFVFITMPIAMIAGVLGVSWLQASDHMQAIVGSVFLVIMSLLFGIARQYRLAIEQDRRAALAVSERELRTILDNMQDTYYRTDQDGRIVRASASATQLLGYAPDEVLGMRLADFYLDADGRERFQAALHAASGTLRNYEAALRHRDGSLIWVSTNAQYVRAVDGRVIGIEGTARDVTERKRVDDRLLDIARGVSATTGETFFQSLVAHLAQSLHADYAFVGELAPHRMDRIQTVAVQAGERRVEDFEYDLAGTPCQNVVGRETCAYPRAVQEQFPEDHMLAEMGVHAYVGTPLFESSGMALGLLVVLYRQPIENDQTIRATLEIFAARAAAELERLRAELALVQSENNFRALTENANVGILVNHRGKHVFANNRLLDMLGYTTDEIHETGVKELVHPREYDKVMERFRDRMNGNPIPGVYETVFMTKAGEAVPVELTVTRTTWQGEPAGLVMLQDIRERLRSETQMRKLSSALEQTADAVVITDRQGVIEYVNQGFEKTTGYGRDEAVGQTPGLLKSGKQGAGFYKKLWLTILAGEVFSEVFVNRRKDSSLYYEEKTITPLKDATGQITNFVATGKDVSERMQTQERLAHMAQHDALTELPNRLLFMDRLKQALARARWHERLAAVLFVDLDRFKTINDTLGHEVGDRLLQALAGRLAASVREGDTVARFGGDEFAILLDDVASEKDISAVAQKVIEMLAPPFEIDGQMLYITASIGVSLYPNDGEDSTTLIKNADIAMYRAKDLGKNTYQFYSADMSARAFERLTLESSLRHAIERNEFRLYYQPQIDTASGAILGVEALLRWQHPDFGLVAPAEFIPLLEETGLIVPVGDWVFRTACEQLCAWHAAGWPELRMAVNLSPRQFQIAGLAIMVERGLVAVGCDPGLIEMEITENILLKHAADTLATLDALRALGVRLSIDDFGTGYSSLSYLRRYAIDTLKIDRSFVRDVPEDADGCAITSAIISLAQNLKLDVIAEGVETELQRDFLREHGCHVMQGYLFSRPLPAEEIPRLLATRNPKG